MSFIIIEILKHSILDSSIQIRINSIEALMNLEHNKSYELISSLLY